MTASAESLVLAALSRVLDLDPSGLRSDTPLDTLGVDSLARICLADALEGAAGAAEGTPVRIDDAAVADARTVADLAAALAAARSAGGSDAAPDGGGRP